VKCIVKVSVNTLCFSCIARRGHNLQKMRWISFLMSKIFLLFLLK